MIDQFSLLWEFLTVFFSDTVIYQPLFMSLILFNLLFATVYLLLRILGFVGGAR